MTNTNPKRSATGGPGATPSSASKKRRARPRVCASSSVIAPSGVFGVHPRNSAPQKSKIIKAANCTVAKPLHTCPSSCSTTPSSSTSESSWNEAEDSKLRESVLKNGEQWQAVSEYLVNSSSNEQLRTARDCEERWFSVVCKKHKKGPWTEEEDALVCELVRTNGPKKWSSLAAFVPGRTGKQCRERWVNHLSPDVNKGEWTEEEEQTLIKEHERLGNQWCKIAQALPGRSENAVKNRWNSFANRCLTQRRSDNGRGKGRGRRASKPLPSISSKMATLDFISSAKSKRASMEVASFRENDPTNARSRDNLEEKAASCTTPSSVLKQNSIQKLVLQHPKALNVTSDGKDSACGQSRPPTDKLSTMKTSKPSSLMKLRQQRPIKPLIIDSSIHSSKTDNASMPSTGTSTEFDNVLMSPEISPMSMSISPVMLSPVTSPGSLSGFHLSNLTCLWPNSPDITSQFPMIHPLDQYECSGTHTSVPKDIKSIDSSSRPSSAYHKSAEINFAKSKINSKSSSMKSNSKSSKLKLSLSMNDIVTKIPSLSPITELKSISRGAFDFPDVESSRSREPCSSFDDSIHEDRSLNSHHRGSSQPSRKFVSPYCSLRDSSNTSTCASNLELNSYSSGFCSSSASPSSLPSPIPFQQSTLQSFTLTSPTISPVIIPEDMNLKDSFKDSNTVSPSSSTDTTTRFSKFKDSSSSPTHDSPSFRVRNGSYDGESEKCTIKSEIKRDSSEFVLKSSKEGKPEGSIAKEPAKQRDRQSGRMVVMAYPSSSLGTSRSEAVEPPETTSKTTQTTVSYPVETPAPSECRDENSANVSLVNRSEQWKNDGWGLVDLSEPSSSIKLSTTDN